MRIRVLFALIAVGLLATHSSAAHAQQPSIPGAGLYFSQTVVPMVTKISGGQMETLFIDMSWPPDYPPFIQPCHAFREVSWEGSLLPDHGFYELTNVLAYEGKEEEADRMPVFLTFRASMNERGHLVGFFQLRLASNQACTTQRINFTMRPLSDTLRSFEP